MAYLYWLRHFGENAPDPPNVGVLVAERVTFRANFGKGGTQAFFQIDRKPMELSEVQLQLRWLQHSRATLLALVEDLPQSALQWGIPGIPGRPLGKRGGGWTVDVYLRHIADAEKWYMRQFWSRLPALTRSRTTFDRLDFVRRQALEVVGRPSPEDLNRVAEAAGEPWTLRKVLRRMLYHERYHMRSIARLLVLGEQRRPEWITRSLGIPALFYPPTHEGTERH